MPKGDPKNPETKKKVERFKKDKWITEKQYNGLGWNHLLQIGTFNQKTQKHPKSTDEWKKKFPKKSHAEWQSQKKGKRNEMYRATKSPSGASHGKTKDKKTVDKNKNKE